MLNFGRYEKSLSTSKLTLDVGKVTQVTGFLIRGYIPGACVGGICEVYPMVGNKPFLAEVVGFKDREVLLMPLGEMRGIGLGSKIVLNSTQAVVKVGDGLLGRVIQHEYDHLDGIEFVEKITDLKRITSKEFYIKLIKPLPEVNTASLITIKEIEQL